MGSLNKISVILLAVSLILVVSNVSFYFAKNVEQHKRESVESQFNKTSQEFEKSRAAAETLQKAKDGLELRLKDTENKISGLNGENAEERKKNSQLTAAISAKDMENQTLKNSLSEETRKKQEVMDRLSIISKDAKDAKSQVEEVENVKEESRKKIQELEREVEELRRDKDTASLGTVIIKNGK